MFGYMGCERVHTRLCLKCGDYQTGLCSYFICGGLKPALSPPASCVVYSAGVCRGAVRAMPYDQRGKAEALYNGSIRACRGSVESLVVWGV